MAVSAACDSGPVASTRPTTPTPPTAITVGPGQGFTRIQDAIDAAAPGGSITVLAGTYAERLDISKPLKLYGNQAILDGRTGGLDGRYVGMEVKAPDVEITGFVVQNFERGTSSIRGRGAVSPATRSVTTPARIRRRSRPGSPNRTAS